MTLTEQVISRVTALQTEKIPAEVMHAAKRALLDYCGVVISGACKNHTKTHAYISGLCEGGTHSVFGTSAQTDIYSAVLLNGINAHLIELDDGHRFGMMHMGAPVISAVLTLAEGQKINGEKQLRAIIAGYETAIALSKVMQPGHKLRGYHATGTCCTVGCAMAAAVLLDFTEEQIQGALSAAAAGAAGILEMNQDASELKPYNVGRAALDGIAAAMAGRAGFRGPNDAIGGERGFYAVLADRKDLPRILESKLFQKGQYCISEIYFKPYAACRHCHPPIEAALHIREQITEEHSAPPDAGMIGRITVRTYGLAIHGHDHTAVSGITSAKMSTPYAMTAALLTGEAGVPAYTESMLHTPEIGQVMQKIRMVTDPELDKLNPQKRAAVVEIQLKDGTCYENRVDYPRGEPENPITDKELEQKMAGLFSEAGRSNASDIIQCVWDYEHQADRLIELMK